MSPHSLGPATLCASRKWSPDPRQEQENRAAARFVKPSAGLEPATPSLPCAPGEAREGVRGSLRASNVLLREVGMDASGCRRASPRGTADVPVSFPPARSARASDWPGGVTIGCRDTDGARSQRCALPPRTLTAAASHGNQESVLSSPDSRSQQKQQSATVASAVAARTRSRAATPAGRAPVTRPSRFA